MKTALLAILTIASAVRAVDPVTTETVAELCTTLDANADGRVDLLVLDRASGLFRQARQQTDGTLTWMPATSCGLDQVAALSAGQFTAGGGHGVVVAAPDWNRMQIFPTLESVPVVVAGSATGVGPDFAVAVNVSGAGDDPAVDDVVMASGNNGAPNPFMAGASRWDGTAATGFQVPVSAPLRHGNRVRLVSGGPWLAGAIRPAGAGSEFVAMACTETECTGVAAATGLPAGTDWICYDFAGNGRSQFVFFSPGAGSLVLRPINPGPVFGAGLTFSTGQPVVRVLAVPKASGALLLVIFGDGSTASVFEFNGTTAPVFRQALTAPAGQRFSSGGALGDGHFLLLHGPEGGSGPSTGWQRWNWNGNAHVPAASGALPDLNAGSRRANVFLFSSDPFDDPGIRPVLSLSAGDWTTSAVPDGNRLDVTAERWLDAASGLGAPEVFSFSGPYFIGQGIPVSPDLAVSLTNQVSDDSGIWCLVPGIGEPGPDVRFSPPPGTYHPEAGQALTVRIESGQPGTVLYWRTSAAAAWSIFDPAAPVQISATSTIEARAFRDLHSPVRRGVFVIAPPPAIQPAAPTDTDHDGLSDAWEAAFGLPEPTADADGDGFTNLAEFNAGTDPLDSLSRPAGGPLPLPSLSISAGLVTVTWDASGVPVVLEVSSNLSDWEPADPPPQSNLWAEPANVRRYYRLRSP